MRFNKGDKVVRMSTFPPLEKGGVYTVKESDPEYITVEECSEGVWYMNEEFDLYQEPFGKRFFGHKIKVTPETSEMIQKAVFEAGGMWGGSGDTHFKFPQDNHLEINSDGIMWRQSWEQINPIVPELIVELEVVKSLKIVDVIPAKTPEQLRKEARIEQIKKLEEELAKLKEME
jgi:hypothetical protein